MLSAVARRFSLVKAKFPYQFGRRVSVADNLPLRNILLSLDPKMIDNFQDAYKSVLEAVAEKDHPFLHGVLSSEIADSFAGGKQVSLGGSSVKNVYPLLMHIVLGQLNDPTVMKKADGLGVITVVLKEFNGLSLSIQCEVLSSLVLQEGRAPLKEQHHNVLFQFTPSEKFDIMQKFKGIMSGAYSKDLSFLFGDINKGEWKIIDFDKCLDVIKKL